MKTSSNPRIELSRTEMIRRTPGEVYRYWKDTAHLARLVDERIQVKVLSAKTWHWTVRVPGWLLEWTTELVSDEPNRRIGWRSLPDENVASAGAVTFSPLDNGEATIVTLTMEIVPPGGLAGAIAGGIVRDALGQEIAAMLCRLKTEIESRE